MNQLSKFFNKNYIFDTTPNAPQELLYVLIILFIFIFAISIFFKMRIKKQKDFKLVQKALKKYPIKIQIFLLIGVFLLLTRLGGIPILSMRFLLLIDMAFILYFIIKAVYIYHFVRPKLMHLEHNKSEKDKYLPKAKKR